MRTNTRLCSMLAFLVALGLGTTPTAHAQYNCAAQIEVAAQDCEALVAFIEATNIEEVTEGAGRWGSGAIPDWQGVSVQEGRVTVLNLHGLQLSGFIPVALAELSALLTLSLGENKLERFEAGSYDGWTSLQTVGLVDNAFRELPDLSGLPALQTLWVFSNALTFEDLEPLASLVGTINFRYWPMRLVVPEVDAGAVSVNTGGAKTTYQWYEGPFNFFNQPIPGATEASYTVAESGLYYGAAENEEFPQLTLRSEVVFVEAVALLDVSPAPIEFINPAHGETETVAITNVSNADLAVVDIAVEPTDLFTLQNAPATPLVLPPGTALSVDVQYIGEGNQRKKAGASNGQDGALRIVTDAAAPNDRTAIPIDVKTLSLKGVSVREAIRVGGDLTGITVSIVDEETGATATDVEGNAVYRILDKSTAGIGQRLTATLSSIESGEAQDVFLETTGERFHENAAITRETVLAGTTYVEVRLEHAEQVKPDTVEVHLKSPFDFFIDRIEVQQGIAKQDQAVTLEYQPEIRDGVIVGAEERTFAPLDFIADHVTALRVFVDYDVKSPLSFSSILGIRGLRAHLHLFRDGVFVGALNSFDFDPLVRDPFEFHDPPTRYSPQEQAELKDALFGVIAAEQIAEPGRYRFEVALSTAPHLDEMPEDKENNVTSVTLDLVGTRPLRVLTRVARQAGEPEATLPEVPASIWSFLRAAFPVQSSKVTYNDPRRTPYELVGPVNLQTLTALLNRHNVENPGDQRDKIIVFTNSAPMIEQVCGPDTGGCAIRGGKAAILRPTQLLLAHELGHTLGLRDTYKTSKYQTADGEPNPRRSDATDEGNIVEDGNIVLRDDLISLAGGLQMLRSVNTLYFDFMGGDPPSTWVDRATWDHLYSTHFKADAPGKGQGASATDFIAITGTITRTGSVTFSPFLRMLSVPGVSLPSEGAYAIEFRDGAGAVLGDFTFDVLFHIPEVGDVDEVPFAFDLPLPAGTRTLALLQADTVLASRTFSDQAPVVDITSPAPGTLLEDTLTLAWNASDADGDALTYDLLYSPDGVEEQVLAVHLSSPTYTLDTGRLSSSTEARFTVIANDGVNEGRASVPVSVVSTAREDEVVIPAFFQLSPNYPNPFNPITTISYQLPVSSQVRLAVYDVLGREVAVLVDDALPAGTHQARFDAGRLANGVYVYRLTADGFSQARTMMLVR